MSDTPFKPGQRLLLEAVVDDAGEEIRILDSHGNVYGSTWWPVFHAETARWHPYFIDELREHRSAQLKICGFLGILGKPEEIAERIIAKAGEAMVEAYASRKIRNAVEAWRAGTGNSASIVQAIDTWWAAQL